MISMFIVCYHVRYEGRGDSTYFVRSVEFRVRDFDMKGFDLEERKKEARQHVPFSDDAVAVLHGVYHIPEFKET